MDAAIIICVILGAACLAASFFVKEGKESSGVDREELEKEIKALLSDHEAMNDIVSKAGERIKENMEEEMTERMEKAKKELSENSNTKMTAFSEMSDQIFAKLEENHKEVIFLYDMLNEKSEALKDFSAKIEGMKKQLTENERSLSKHDSDETGRKEYEESDGKTKKKTEKGEKHSRSAKGKKERVEKKTEQNSENEEGLTRNDRILLMHKEGKSAPEISKELRIGQGEVSLILGLYADKN